MAIRLLPCVVLALAIGCSNEDGGAGPGTGNSGTGATGAGGAGATGGSATSGGSGGSGASAGSQGSAGAGGASGAAAGSAGAAGAAAGAGGTAGTGGQAGTPDGGGSGGLAGTSGSAGAAGSADGGTATPTQTTVITIPSQTGCTAPYPHDPAVDEATGNVYYADSNVSCIGEYNPDTRQFRSWRTPTANSYPHGLVVDDQSRVFYTGQDANRVGRLIPSSGAIVDFPVAATGPHTPVFHQGRIWFTAQQGNQYGHVDRDSGAAQVWSFPTNNSRPYGVWPAPDGSLWVAQFGTNRIARIDTSATPPSVQEFPLPNSGSRPRRIAVDASGRVWYTDYARRMLGLMDPRAAQASRFAEFQMPGGGQPYAIAIGPDGRVWVNDEDAPEMVGFDPESRTVIARLPVPVANAGPVRNMSVDRVRKRIWLAISNVGRLGVLQF